MLRFLLVLALVPALAACDAGTATEPDGEGAAVTLAGFDRLENGMTYDEVVAILGGEGTQINEIEVMGTTTVMYEWEGKSFAMFQNGEMVSKAQFEAPDEEELAEGEGAGVTLANYDSLKNGMTYEEVAAILGGEGEEINKTDLMGITTVMYKWDGQVFGMFQNGEMISKARFGIEE